MTPLKRALCCAVVSTLLFSGHFRAYLDPKIRYLRFSQHSDVLPLVLAIVLLSLLFFAASSLLLRAGGKWEKTARACFVLVLAQGLLVILRPPETTIVWATVFVWAQAALIIFFEWRNPQFAVSRRLAKLALILTPLPLILVVQFLAMPALPSQCKPAHWNPTPGTTPGAPIVIVVFDEWSFHRTFLSNGPPDCFPRLQELYKTSTFYQNAQSSDRWTYSSVPRLLFQTNASLTSVGSQIHPPSGLSIFDRAPHGYKKAVVGFFLPYRSMLSDDLDSCQTFTAAPTGDGLIMKTALHFIDILVYWQDPWVRLLRRPWYGPGWGAAGWDKPIWLVGPYWYQLSRRTVEQANTVLTTMPGNTIAFFHFPFPHPPMVYNADGSYRKPRLLDFEVPDPNGYRLNLMQLDRTLGGMIDILKNRHLWDQTLFVISTDHGWRLEQNVQHVPLLIKFPHQKEPAVEDKPFDLTRLSEVFAPREPGHIVSTKLNP